MKISIHKPRFKAILLLGLFFFLSTAAMATIEITQKMNPSSNEQCDGYITVRAEGTAGPFFIQMTTADGAIYDAFDVNGSYTFEGLCSDFYTIKVYNEYACVSTLQTTLGCPLHFDVVIDEDCLEGGSISISPTSGTAPYTYTWQDEQGNTLPSQANLTNLESGTYHLTLTESGGCQTTESFQVDNRPADNRNEYPFVKEVKVFTPGQIQTFYHAVWEKNASGCYDLNILEDNPLEGNLYGGPSNIIFEVSFNMAMSSADLQLELSGITPQNSPAFSLSSDGLSVVNSTGMNFTLDSWNSSYSIQLNISGQDEDGNALLDMRAMSNNLTACVILPHEKEDCNPSLPPTGTDIVHEVKKRCVIYTVNIDQTSKGIQLTDISGSIANIIWEGPNGFYEEGPQKTSISNLEEGIYHLTIIPAGEGSCRIIEEDIEFVDCSLLGEKVDLAVMVNPACSKIASGRICIDGDLTNWQFKWAHNGSSSNCLEDILGDKTYTVTVTDERCEGISVVKEIYLPDNDYNPYPRLVLADEERFICEGQVCVQIRPAVRAPFQVMWDKGGRGLCPTQELLPGKTYAYTLTDGCGEEFPGIFTVPQIEELAIIELEKIYPCPGSENGSLSVGGTGGAAPYNFQWSGPNNFTSAEANIDNLAPGEYHLSVTDQCGNLKQQIFNLTEAFPTALSAEVGDACENYLSDGSTNPINSGFIHLNIEAFKNLPLSYLWSNGETSKDIDNLEQGGYSVTVTDNSGCRLLETFLVGTNSIPELEATITHTCTNNGLISLPNIPGLQYQWDNGSVGHFIYGLTPGDYCVTLTNQEGCIREACYTVNNSSVDIEIDLVSWKFPDNQNDNSGEIDVDVRGGTGELSYQWSNGSIFEDLALAPSGNYTLTVTDAIGCTTSRSFYIDYCYDQNDWGFAVPRFTPVEVVFDNLVPLSGPTSGDGSMAFDISAGTGLLALNWHKPNGDIDYLVKEGGGLQTFSNLDEFRYCLSVSNGCSEDIACQLIAYCGDVGVNYSYAPPAGGCYRVDNLNSIVTASVSMNNRNGSLAEVNWSFPSAESGYPYNDDYGAAISYQNILDNSAVLRYPTVTMRDEAYCEASQQLDFRQFVPEFNGDWVGSSFNIANPTEATAKIQLQNLADHSSFSFSVDPYVEGCNSFYRCDATDEWIQLDGTKSLRCYLDNPDNAQECECDAHASKFIYCGGLDPVLAEYIDSYDAVIDIGSGYCQNIRYCLFYAPIEGIPFIFKKVLDAYECNPGSDPSGDVVVLNDYPSGIPGCDVVKVTKNLIECSIDTTCINTGELVGRTMAEWERCYKREYPNQMIEYVEYIRCSLGNGFIPTGNRFDEEPNMLECPPIALKDNNDPGELTNILNYQFSAVDGDLPVLEETIIAQDGSDEFVLDIYPNPFSNSFTLEIQIAEEEEVTGHLLNILGQSVFTTTFKLVKGKNTFQVQPEINIPKGIYQLLINRSDGSKISRKVIHQ
jgi:hypothetical protein